MTLRSPPIHSISVGVGLRMGVESNSGPPNLSDFIIHYSISSLSSSLSFNDSLPTFVNDPPVRGPLAPRPICTGVLSTPQSGVVTSSSLFLLVELEAAAA